MRILLLLLLLAVSVTVIAAPGPVATSLTIHPKTIDISDGAVAHSVRFVIGVAKGSELRQASIGLRGERPPSRSVVVDGGKWIKAESEWILDKDVDKTNIDKWNVKFVYISDISGADSNYSDVDIVSMGFDYSFIVKDSKHMCTSDIDCSNHGMCSKEPGICYCDYGWAGTDCSVADADQLSEVDIVLGILFSFVFLGMISCVYYFIRLGRIYWYRRENIMLKPVHVKVLDTDSFKKTPMRGDGQDSAATPRSNVDVDLLSSISSKDKKKTASFSVEGGNENENDNSSEDSDGDLLHL